MTRGSAAARVTIYGRPDCHLCDDARAVVERVRARTPFTLVQVDIESDDALFKRYLEKIPVVTVNGVEIFHHFVDAQTLLDTLHSLK